MELPSFRICELCEPYVGLRFGHDRQNFDGRTRNIIEHPDIVNAQPILRPTQSSQPFDATATRFLRLVPQMRFERTSHRHPNVRRQPPEVFDGFRGKNDGTDNAS
jgi:hypothetical protein